MSEEDESKLRVVAMQLALQANSSGLLTIDDVIARAGKIHAFIRGGEVAIMPKSTETGPGLGG